MVGGLSGVTLSANGGLPCRNILVAYFMNMCTVCGEAKLIYLKAFLLLVSNINNCLEHTQKWTQSSITR